MKIKNVLTKSLLALTMLMGATSVWAEDETIFSATPLQTLSSSVNVSASSTLEITSTYADVSGGTLTASNTDTKAYDFIAKSSSYYSFLIAGSKAGFKIELTKALADGDVISVNVLTNGSGTSNDRGIYVTTATSRPGSDPSCTLVGHSDTGKEYANDTYTVTTGDGICGETTVYIWRKTSNNTYFKDFAITRPVAATPTAENLKASSSVKKDDVALTLDNATNGYTIDGNTITLSDDIQALTTPSDIELVKTITYDDASTTDEDVAVAFDGTVTAGYYIGTASIGLTGSETVYTVRVKKNVNPTAALSATSGSIAITNSYTVIGTTTVTLTGGNLTDGEYNVTADVPGTTISPASFTVSGGSVEQEFTVTSTASSAATTIFTFGTSDMGVTAPTYTLSYSKVAQNSLSQTIISEATTWDWTKAGSNTIELTANTSPANNEEFLMANLPEVSNDANFNSQALKIATQYVTRGTNYYFQGYRIKFTTTLPGTVDVDFSNTGGDRPYRYLRVNGVLTTFKSGVSSATVNATGITVPAGEVTIDFYIPDASDPKERSGDNVGTTMCRVYKIVFTPEIPATIPSSGYGTIASAYAIDCANLPSGVTAYKVSALSASAATLEEVTTAVAEGTGLILNGTAGEYSLPVVASGTDISATNKLKAAVTATTLDDGSFYILQSGEFHLVTGAADDAARTVPAGKAYLLASDVPAGARDLKFVFGDEATGISSMQNSEFRMHNEVFNLKGQRVAAPQKGLYIVNGKKVIVK